MYLCKNEMILTSHFGNLTYLKLSTNLVWERDNYGVTVKGDDLKFNLFSFINFIVFRLHLNKTKFE